MPGHVNEEEIIQNLLTMSLAGTDSNSTLILKVIEYFGMYYDKYGTQIVDEVNKIVPNLDEFNFAQLAQLKFVDAFLNEVQRIETPFPITFPRIARRNIEVTPSEQNLANLHFTIPEGDQIAPCLHAVHMSKRHFKDATEFRPERWLDKSENLVQSLMTFLPGARRCIAEHAAIIMAKIIVVVIAKTYKVHTKRPENERLATLLAFGPLEERVITFTRV